MLRALLKAIRPKQWAKNAIVLAAVVFDRQLPNPFSATSHSAIPLMRCLAGVFIFCLLSSSVYLINDIMDIEADRNHPVKKNRPIASGKLPIPVAILTAVVLSLLSFFAAASLSMTFFGIVAAYFIINLLYSKWLKHIPLLDVLILASGFVLRVAGGVSLIEVERFSPWLYVVTTLLALYLGFGKRRAELTTIQAGGLHTRKVLDGYTLPFLDQLITIVSSTTLITYSLYTFSAPNLPDNHTMMLTIPFVLYGIFRYLFLIQIKQDGGAPEDILFKDRPLQLAIILWGLSILLIFYFS